MSRQKEDGDLEAALGTAAGGPVAPSETRRPAAYYRDEWLTIREGDCRAVLAEMEPESVHCVVTSPPYWGLRDYGTPGQLGLEPTPEEYVAALVDVFRAVRRVLRADGTVWLNLGDSYASGEVGRVDAPSKAPGLHVTQKPRAERRIRQLTGLKHKDLVGIPWRVAFALQADGWYLRSDIIWSKPNPMPESVTDRPTKSHEYLFLLSKSARYFFDADAVREPMAEASESRYGYAFGGAKAERLTAEEADGPGTRTHPIGFREAASGRNIRSVWTIATSPYPGSHFATFPPKLVEPCIKAGTSERGVCPECGAPWERVVEREPATSDGRARPSPVGVKHEAVSLAHRTDGHGAPGALVYRSSTTGWRPTCAHYDPEEARIFGAGTFTKYGNATTVPGVVLDPFAGTGTVGLVAQRLSRRAVLIDLNAEYLRQCLVRNAQTPLGLEVPA